MPQFFLNDSYNSKGEKACPGKALRCGLIYVEICVVLISHVGMYGARHFQRLSAWGLEGVGVDGNSWAMAQQLVIK